MVSGTYSFSTSIPSHQLEVSSEGLSEVHYYNISDLAAHRFNPSRLLGQPQDYPAVNLSILRVLLCLDASRGYKNKSDGTSRLLY